MPARPTPALARLAMTTAPPEGLLLLDKPAGMTSHDCVDVVRRAYSERSVGHLGTLDPFATGLLVVLVGRATRLANFIDVELKTYEATIEFGRETDTDDLTGAVTRTAPAPDAAAVRSAIEELTGEIEQLPPDYSAKQVGGRRAYAAARAGEPLALKPVRVRVHEWRVRSLEAGRLETTIVCAGGTYVRSLARDLGRATGSAAHLAALRRTGVGGFDVRDATTLEQLRRSPPPLRRLRVTADA
ncbi:tRNA pseudouridine(55) synthase TruB [soil metagenome]